MSHFVCACTPKAAKTAQKRNIFDFMTILRSAGILTYFLQHGAGEGEGGRKSRRLDAEEVDQAWHAMLARSLDVKVGRRLAGAGGLRPDARVARKQRAVGQRGP